MQLLSDFEAIFKRFLNSFDHLGRFFIVKLGVRTAEEVIERFVPSPGQNVVLERSITWLKEVLEHLFHQRSNGGTEALGPRRAEGRGRPRAEGEGRGRGPRARAEGAG